MTWDVDSQVESVSISGGGTTWMAYDYSGMRVKKDGGPSSITLYPFKGYEIDPGGTMTKLIRIGNETFASKVGTNKRFYHNDHLGGVNAITDMSGARCQLNEYDPWGKVSLQTGNCDPTRRFTGQELDPETDLYYYGGRYYDYEISRFVSPDPYVQAPENPQNLNRYSYVLNNPVNLVDPSGHFFWIPAVIEAVIVAIANIAADLLVVDGVLTGVGIAVEAAKVITAVVGIGAGSYDLAAKSELRDQQKRRAADMQRGSNAQQARPDWKREDPNWSKMNPGDDYPNGERSGWKDSPGNDYPGEIKKDPISLAMGPLRMIPRRLWQLTPQGRGMPKPPGWTKEWKWGKSKYTSSPKKGPRWIDPKGGEWRWSSIDENPYHMD